MDAAFSWPQLKVLLFYECLMQLECHTVSMVVATADTIGIAAAKIFSCLMAI